jgi:hypothetical protein
LGDKGPIEAENSGVADVEEIANPASSPASQALADNLSRTGLAGQIGRLERHEDAGHVSSVAWHEAAVGTEAESSVVVLGASLVQHNDEHSSTLDRETPPNGELVKASDDSKGVEPHSEDIRTSENISDPAAKAIIAASTPAINDRDDFISTLRNEHTTSDDEQAKVENSLRASEGVLVKASGESQVLPYETASRQDVEGDVEYLATKSTPSIVDEHVSGISVVRLHALLTDYRRFRCLAM